MLSVKNTAAARTVTLSGSDDTSHWFVIKENIVLANNSNENNKTSFNQAIHFPYSNYRYFQISMQGNNLLPLNIFEAGIYNTTAITNNNIYEASPPPNIVQHDSSNKKSYIKLQFDNHYRIDRLQCSFTGAKFFNRSFNLYDGNNTANTVLASDIITSLDSSTTVNLQAKTNSLLLVINNLDNAPLAVEKIAAYQLPVSLIAYVNAGKKYSLYFGDSALQAPVYDLQYFSDSIHTNPALLEIKSIQKLPEGITVKTAADNHLSTWALWSIIIAVLLLLIYFSYALLKDINRKNTNTDAHL